jgi:predicted O-linked N-acetylglucosamine transferase (SPINDLY family)
MALYDGIDIALDPVGGIGGGTTTCEALWMGVPVVTLAGVRHADRMTVAMLDALGYGAWAAETADGYVERVGALAADTSGRRQLRTSLRATMAASTLCDSKSLVTALEEAYASMFDRWQAKRNDGAG